MSVRIHGGGPAASDPDTSVAARPVRGSVLISPYHRYQVGMMLRSGLWLLGLLLSPVEWQPGLLLGALLLAAAGGILPPFFGRRAGTLFLCGQIHLTLLVVGQIVLHVYNPVFFLQRDRDPLPIVVPAIDLVGHMSVVACGIAWLGTEVIGGLFGIIPQAEGVDL